jgi:outer membrane lipoprotein-sorting protein
MFGILTLVAIAAALALPAQAETSAEAKAWLEKLSQIYNKGPVSMDYVVTTQTSQMGQSADLTMTGKVTYGDERHLRMDFNMTMAMAGAAMEMKALSVADGETMWMDVESPMMGGRQVMKVALDRVGDLDKAGGGGMGGGSMDPMSQIRELTEKYDFQVTDVSGGRVTLTAELNAEQMKEMTQGQGSADAGKLTLVIDEKTGVPLEFSMGGATPFVTMQLSNAVFHEPGSLPEDFFTYVPPEGAMVVDLEQMMGTP